MGIAIMILTTGCDNHNEDNDILIEVDQAVTERSLYSSEREKLIRSHKNNLTENISDTDRYNIYRSLFSTYRNYRTDSALWVARKRLELARKINDTPRITSATLNLVECLIAVANYSEALNILDTLPRNKLSTPYHHGYLYELYTSTYRHLGETNGLEEHKLRYRKLSQQYRDSSLSILNDSEPDYHYMRIQQLLDAGYTSRAKIETERTLSQFGENVRTPKMLILAGKVYKEAGMPEQAIELLAEATLKNIKEGSRESSALISLAEILRKQGDNERAYKYAQIALQDAIYNNSRTRITDILEQMPLISNSYADSEKRNLEQARQQLIINLVLTLILVVLLTLVAILLIRRRKIACRLEETNSLLRAANDKLKSANSSKSLYIYQWLYAYSEYIERTSTYRKNIRRLLKASQIQSAIELLENKKIVSDEIKYLYRKFDSMFLNLYPDFIAEYNSHVREDEQLPEDIESLPAKVRVLALMKTGVTDQRRIAELLHYNPQTVYNYYSQLRATMIIPYDLLELSGK